MPSLEQENDTYREFFSRDNCLTICRNDREHGMMLSFADLVPDLISNEIRQMASNGQLVQNDDQEDLELIPLIAKALKKIIEDFQNNVTIETELKKRFPTFKKKRKDTVEKLREVARKINLDKWNCNVSTEVGAVTGIVGGGMLIGGIVASILTAGAALPLFVAGGIACGLGTGTTLGTAITETVRLENDKAAAQKAIDEDRENLQCFSKYLDETYDAKEALKDVLDVDILQRTVDDIITVLKSTIEFQRKIDDMQGRIRIFVNTYLTAIGHFSNISFWITTLSLIVGFVIALVSIRSQNTLLYESGMTILKIGISVCRFLDIGVDACTAIFSTLRVGGTLATSVGRATAHGSFAVLGMSLDIATVVLTSIDIHNGSISQTATKINEAADKLEQELELLEKVYNEF